MLKILRTLGKVAVGSQIFNLKCSATCLITNTCVHKTTVGVKSFARTC